MNGRGDPVRGQGWPHGGQGGMGEGRLFSSWLRPRDTDLLSHTTSMHILDRAADGGGGSGC